MKQLYIIGAGGHGAVVAELAATLGYDVAGFVDTNAALHGSTVLDFRVLGGLDCVPGRTAVALGVGGNVARSRLLDEALVRQWCLPALVHPSAVISPSARIGSGTVVMAQAVVNSRSYVGVGCILNTACSVDHDCALGNAVHIAPGARLAGGVTVADRTLIGVGSAVKPGTSIGAECLFGAGSVIVSDFPDGVIAYGNPAAARGKNRQTDKQKENI